MDVRAPLAAYVAAEAATPAQSITGQPVLDLVLDNLGPTLVVVLFLTGKLATGTERDRLAEKLERTEARELALRDGYDERVIPLLTRTVDLVERLEDRLEVTGATASTPARPRRS